MKVHLLICGEAPCRYERCSKNCEALMQVDFVQDDGRYHIIPPLSVDNEELKKVYQRGFFCRIKEFEAC